MRRADDIQSCFHVEVVSSTSSGSASSGGELSFSVQDRSLWPSSVRRDECSPPPGKFDGEIWEQASGSVEDYRRGLDERVAYPCISPFKHGMRIEHCIKAGCGHHFAPNQLCYRMVWYQNNTEG